jgi:hypothetical protein
VDNVFKIVPNERNDFACDLRGLADMIDEGDFGVVLTVTVVVETDETVMPFSYGHRDGIRTQGLLLQAAINQGLDTD